MAGGEFSGNLGYLDEDSVCEPTYDSTFAGGGIVEDVEGIGSDCFCYDNFTNGCGGTTFSPMVDDNWGWTVGTYSSYWPDFISYDADYVYYFSTWVNSKYISPCSLWYGGQSLYYNGEYYWWNSLGVYLDSYSNTATRGSLTVSF